MATNKGIGGHQSANSTTNEWLTPPEIIQALGVFDLDPCAPIIRPWDTAKTHYTIDDNGLLLPWFGRVWLNPPYGREMYPFLNLMAAHKYGIALTFARTETEAFHKYVWPFASSILFLKGRLTFYDVYGQLAIITKEGKNQGKVANGGAPSVLISYSEFDAQAIEDSGISGKHLPVNSMPMIIVGLSGSWKNVIKLALSKSNGRASVQRIYELVELIAPDKVKKNTHYKEKIRQQLQENFIRISKGIYHN